MSSAWHLDAGVARRYAEGRTDLPLGASIEAHLIVCPGCRESIGSLVPAGRLDGIWDGVVAGLDAPRPRLVELLLTRLGLGEDAAHLIATTPSLRVSWLSSLVLVSAFAAVAAAQGDRGVLVFLTAAPLLPVAGVAAAYAGVLDPLRRVTEATPYPKFRLLLLRTVAVLVTSVGLAAVAGFAVLGTGWRAAAWLLPALAMVATTLALCARFRPVRAAAAVAAGWVAAVWCHAPRLSFAAFAPPAQLVYLLVTAVALGAVLTARTRYEYGRSAR